MRNIIEPWMKYFFKNAAGIIWACEEKPKKNALGDYDIYGGEYKELHATKPYGNFVDMFWPKNERETTVVFTNNNELITRNFLESLIGD